MSNDLGPASIEKIQSALGFLSPHDRNTWVMCGMAVKSEFGDAGFWVWDDWSQAADSYNEKAAKAVWKSFRSGKIGIGTLFYRAKQEGWRWDKPEQRLSAEQVEALREASRLRAEADAAERAKEHAAAAERAAGIWSAAQPATEHPYLTKKGVKAHGLRVGKWEVIDKETGEIRLISPLALLVPIRDRSGGLHSLQAIFPRKAMGGRDKDYLAGGAKSGHFYAIGSPKKQGDQVVFILVEGFATGASVHENTGHCALVCFDASNLMTVAMSIRDRRPDAVIVIAADNDQFNKRNDGTPYNPGVDAARKAAIEVGGKLAVPQFASLDGEPTDFNDLAQREGGDAVRSQIEIALALPSLQEEPEPEQEAPAPWEGPQSFEELAKDLEPEIQADGVKPAPEVDEGDHLSKNKYFTILGYDHGDYHLFIHSKQQVMCFNINEFANVGKLLEIANDINWWEMNFPGQKGGINYASVQTFFIGIAGRRGIYDMRRIRGRGAWLDAGRNVFHHGGYLTVDGVQMGIPNISSSYVYPMGKSFVEPSDSALSKDEGRWLLKVAEMVRWRSEGSAALMAGWVMLAPICGALKWRPHIWITGAAGSGKSTVQRDFCAALLRGVAEYFNGDSTEAGIRQDLKSDAIPVLIDEIESNNESERRRVENIIGMVRKASSETQARTAKGTASGDGMHFMIRSMFCLSSINVNLPGKADIDRLTKLVIRPPGVDGKEHWGRLADELYRITADETISSRLLSRALSMMSVVHEAIAVFTEAAAARFGTQRHGDQYGTLLAGCWCLTNDAAPTKVDAEAMLNRYDWNEHTEDHGEDDATDALKVIMNSKIRMPGSIGDLTVYEIIREAHPKHRTGKIEQDEADATLRRHGIRVEISKDAKGADHLLFGTSVPNFKTLVRDSAYSTDIRGQLLRLKDASKWNGKSVKFLGETSKCVSIPLEPLLADDDDAPSKPPAPSAAAAQYVDEDFPL